jgi:hypothetical protein
MHACLYVQSKMEDHVSSVEKFHGMLSAQTEWLSTAEKRLRALKKPSKIYDGIQAQLRGLKVTLNINAAQNRSDVVHRTYIVDADFIGIVGIVFHCVVCTDLD